MTRSGPGDEPQAVATASGASSQARGHDAGEDSGDEATAIDPRSIPFKDPSPGDSVAGYELLELLGKGGAALVFSARRKRDGRIAALKVLSAQKLSRQRVVQRFRDEARIASTVKHPSLVELIELVEEASPRRLAYAMEYVRGVSLREKLQQQPVLPLREAIHIARQICLGVDALHQAGIIHRDLKPENIMLVEPADPAQPPQVKILDFGVAKFLGKDTESELPAVVETPGTFVGTPRYMAPEQAAGGPIDARSDLFAVGVMLFEMITGQRPHEGDSLKAVVMAKLRGAPRLTMNPDREILPLELADAVDACLKLQPDLRPGNARTVIRILEDAQTVLAAVGAVRHDPAAGVVRANAVKGAGASLPAPKGAGHREQILPRSDVRQETPRPVPPASSSSRPAASRPTGPITDAALLALPEVEHPQAKSARWLLVLPVLALLAIVALGGLLLSEGDEVNLVPSAGEPADLVEIEIRSMPPGAAVAVDGVALGPAPQKIELSPGAKREVQLTLEGHRSRALIVGEGSERTLLVPLEREAAAVPVQPEEVKPAEPRAPAQVPAAPVSPVQAPAKVRESALEGSAEPEKKREEVPAKAPSAVDDADDEEYEVFVGEDEGKSAPRKEPRPPEPADELP